jgi:hypothetical protein
LYASANPVINIDPSGLFDLSLGGFSAAEAIGATLLTIGTLGIVATEPLESLGGFWLGNIDPSNSSNHQELLQELLERLNGFGGGSEPNLPNNTGNSGQWFDDFGIFYILVFNITPEDILKPNGNPIGQPGSRPQIREVTGGINDALDMLAELAKAGGGFQDVTPASYPGIQIRLNSGGLVSVRDKMTNSPESNATLDVNMPSVPEIEKIKFN